MKRTIEVDDLLESSKNALKILLDNAEKRGDEYPVPCEAVAELEFVIHELEYRSI